MKLTTLHWQQLLVEGESSDEVVIRGDVFCNAKYRDESVGEAPEGPKTKTKNTKYKISMRMKNAISWRPREFGFASNFLKFLSRVSESHHIEPPVINRRPRPPL